MSLCGILLIAAIAGMCGCAATDDYAPAVDVWPAFRYWSDADRGESGGETLWPLVRWETFPEGSDFVCGPLYSRRRDKQSNAVETYFLWPFGAGASGPALSRILFFPIFLKDRQTYTDGSVHRRFVLLPLFYRRSGRGKPTDWFIFPLYGKLHNMARQRKMVFILWPLFVYQEGDHVKSWSVVHPILKFIRWDDGGRGFKLWPLFGWNRCPGKLGKYFALWPIFSKEWRKSEQGESRRLFIFPFYGRIDVPKGKARTILWPFFGMRRDDNLHQVDWWYPWPLLGHRTGKEASAVRISPLYFRGTTHKKTEDDGVVTEFHRTYANFLWPIGWYSREVWQVEASEGKPARESKKMSFRIVPLFLREWERAPDASSGAWQVWPLAKYRYAADGEARFEAPSVLPVRHLLEFDRHLGHFFRIFEFHRTAGGDRSWRFLWRVVRLDKGPKARYLGVWPLFSVYKREGKAGKSRWQVLKGLIGHERTGAQRRWRILYFVKLGSRATAAEGVARK